MIGKEHINIELLKILYKKRKFIIITFIIVSFAAAGFSLMFPLWYRAHTTILPPVEDSDMGNFAALISDLPLQALGLGGLQDESVLFMATLKSRTVMEAVAKEFNLMERYETRNMEETVNELRTHVGTNLDDEGTITLFAEAGTPWFSLSNNEKKEHARELARDMANFFIEELDRRNKELKTARATNTRIFIERRYQQNQEDLRIAEEKFNQFQKEYGTIALPEQTTATITVAAELKAQIIAKEIEIGVLENYVGDSHSSYIKAQKELNELNRKYNEFVLSKQQDDSINPKDLFLPFEDIPDLGMQYTRHYREFMMQQTIMEFLVPQYEQAKIQEAKDTPTVQVLDKAVKPIRKYKPKRAIFVIFFGFTSLICSSLYIIFKPTVLDFYKELKS